MSQTSTTTRPAASRATASPSPAAAPRPHARRTAVLKALGYSALTVFALLYLFPFVIQVGTSFKTDPDATANPLNPIPSQFTTAAYQSLFQQDFPLWFGNSVVVAVFVTLDASSSTRSPATPWLGCGSADGAP